MATLSLCIVADASPVLNDLALLAWAVELSPMFRQRLAESLPVRLQSRLEFGQLASELVCINQDIAPATAACELRIRFESGDAFADLACAVRAGEFDDLVVEH